MFKINDKKIEKAQKKKLINERRSKAMARKRKHDEEVKELVIEKRRANEKIDAAEANGPRRGRATKYRGAERRGKI